MDSRLSDSIKKKSSAFEKMKAELPVVIGNMGTNYFLGSFKKQEWDGQKWKEVERRKPRTKAYKYPKTKDLKRRTRAILIGKSGGTKAGAHPHLRAQVSTSLKQTLWDNIEYKITSPYAKRHNEGLDGMPKRQFIGMSPILQQKIIKKIDVAIKNVMTS